MAKSEGKINRAQEDVHREPRVKERLGGSHGRGSDVGNETRADLKGTQLGGSRREAEGAVVHTHEGHGMAGHLGHAVEELHRQHPHHHHDHGPHHGGTEHVRHEPLHGMRPHHGK